MFRSLRSILIHMVIISWSIGSTQSSEPRSQVSPEPPDAQQLLRQFDDLYESSGTTAFVEVIIVKPRKTRTMRMRSWSKGRDRALVVVEAPARDAGTATLKVDQNLWNYLPKISRTIRMNAGAGSRFAVGRRVTKVATARTAAAGPRYRRRLLSAKQADRGGLRRQPGRTGRGRADRPLVARRQTGHRADDPGKRTAN